MEREHAEQLLAAIQSLNPGIDEAARITDSMHDKDEAKILRRHLGSAMAGPLYEIVMHIVRQYPDLDPDIGLLPGHLRPKT
jgi:hypothetical protein